MPVGVVVAFVVDIVDIVIADWAVGFVLVVESILMVVAAGWEVVWAVVVVVVVVMVVVVGAVMFADCSMAFELIVVDTVLFAVDFVVVVNR